MNNQALSGIAAIGLAAALGAVTTNSASAAQSAGEWKSGRQIMEKVCVYCHSPAVGPAVGPVLEGRGLDPAYVMYAVTYGIGEMPAFRPTDFSDRDLKMLADYLRDSKAPVQAPKPSPGILEIFEDYLRDITFKMWLKREH